MKTVLFLLDGMRPDAMIKCKNPYIKELLETSSSTLQAKTVFPSVTLPCHFSLFLSVEPSRHGILTNTFTPQVRPILGLFEQLKTANKTSGFFYSWGELKDLAKPDSVSFSMLKLGETFGYEAVQSYLNAEAKKFILSELPDFVFIYNGMPDEIGHKYGWLSDEYMNALEIGFDWVKDIVEQLPEDYVSIITADHGGHDRMHGTTMDEDMTIPIIIHGKGIEKKQLNGARIIDIAPTIAKLTGIEPNRDWDGISLV